MLNLISTEYSQYLDFAVASFCSGKQFITCAGHFWVSLTRLRYRTLSSGLLCSICCDVLGNVFSWLKCLGPSVVELFARICPRDVFRSEVARCFWFFSLDLRVRPLCLGPSV